MYNIMDSNKTILTLLKKLLIKGLRAFYFTAQSRYAAS
jgi:hypothetical protein